MFQQGSITDEERSRLLILYGLKALGQLIPYDSLVELMIDSDEINYFDFVNDFDSLMATGHIDSFENDGIKVVCITPIGEETLETLEKRIPYSIREKTAKGAMKITSKLRFKSQVYAETDKTEKGYTVTCNILEEDEPMLKLTLGVANKMQAQSIAESFEKDPQKYYAAIVDMFMNDLK